MVALLLYASCLGGRLSWRIERLCERDIAFRVIAANQRLDHTTLARFRPTHETALAALFTDVLRLCAEAGVVKVGVVALDGTKMKADAALAEQQAKLETCQVEEAATGPSGLCQRVEPPLHHAQSLKLWRSGKASWVGRTRGSRQQELGGGNGSKTRRRASWRPRFLTVSAMKGPGERPSIQSRVIRKLNHGFEQQAPRQISKNCHCQMGNPG